MELYNKFFDSKYSSLGEYYCEITSELDRICNINSDSYRKHYILINDYCKKQKCLPIRIPGGTSGGIWIDNDNNIIKIFVNTNYDIAAYPNDTNEQLKIFIGEKLDIN